MLKKKNLIFINSHPIQYFAPLYQFIEKDGRMNVEVWYCSRHGLEGEIDRQFGTSVKWDIPLLEGYKFRFLKNASWKPGIYQGFWGLLNLEVIQLLWSAPKSIVVVHGWNFATNIITLFVAKLFGHKTAIRGEAPITLEMQRSSRSIRNRRITFKLLFSWIDYFLYIGENNRRFYRFYGVKEKGMVFTPYSVDNERFQKAYKTLKPDREKLRHEKGLKEDVVYALFSGKYIEKKRPMDLLNTIRLLQSNGVKVGGIFMGDGELRSEMDTFINENNLQNIVLTGFINQSEIPVYYTIADVFVMCSNAAETWGLSTNEAMNFELPILVSDSVGCSADLVRDDKNGYLTFETNIPSIVSKLESLTLEESKRREFGHHSAETVSEYSYNTITDNLYQSV